MNIIALGKLYNNNNKIWCTIVFYRIHYINSRVIYNNTNKYFNNNIFP